MNIIRISSVLLLSSLLLTGCSGGKEAKKRLEEARSLYENKQFGTAKSVIDSINILYPREVAVRKEALTLMRLAERGESERIIAYCDSVLPVCLDRVEDLKKGFVFEKDTAYDKIGNYIRQTMTVERNVERCYIRCGVNEEGEMYMASVYFGAKPIEHSGLRLSTADGAVAETPSIPCDGGLNYRFNDLGNTTEVVSYKGEHCKTIANLVCITGEKERIKAEYTGGKPYVLYLSDSDKKAVRATYELAMVLSEINAMQKAKSLSEKKIRLIDAKLQ
ncbi:MAG: hypothetical protein LBL57_07240 [Tannerella sp.]|jgi:hypothetical protein|nr:hypothetical protein [Tannerella sp.]